MQFVHKSIPADVVRLRIEVRRMYINSDKSPAVILAQIVFNLRSTDRARAIIEYLDGKFWLF
jgi:hypothetical protein